MTGAVTVARAAAPSIGLWLFLDGEQPSVGGEADLPQCGQVGQPFADPEVPGVIDGGLGAQGAAEFVVILSFLVRQGRDLRRPVMDSVADGTLAA